MEHGERDPRRSADAGEQRDIALAAALDDRDAFAVGVVAEGFERERQRQAFGRTLDEQRRLGEEELAARRVELGQHAQVVVRRERLRAEHPPVVAATRSTKASSSR